MPKVPCWCALVGVLLIGCHGCRGNPFPIGEPSLQISQPVAAYQATLTDVTSVDVHSPVRNIEPDGIVRHASRTGDTLQLESVLHAALATCPDLEAARQRVAIAEASLQRVRADLYPRLNVSEQYAATNTPATAFSYRLNQSQFSLADDVNQPGTVDSFHTQLQLKQQLYSGHRRTANQLASESLYSSAQAELQAAHNELVFASAEAYYRLLQARDLVVLTAEAVAQIDEHLRITRTRYEAQTATKSDVLALEVRLAEMREAHISAENRFTLSWAVLRNVTGADIFICRLPQQVPAAPWSSRVESLEAALNVALSSRPELSALNGRTNAALHDAQAAAADKRPFVDLVADYNVFTGDLSDFNDSYFLGLVLQWNVFDGGRTAHEVERATARIRELQSQHRRLLLDIELDVRGAYLGLRDAEERLRVAACAIEHAEQNLHQLESRYRQEMATTAELLDAQLALTEARVRQATAQAEMQISAASLERAIGNFCTVVM